VLQRHRVVEDFYQGYANWIAHRERANEGHAAMVARDAARWPFQPTFSILMPVYQPPATFFHEAVQSVRAQRYAQWQLCLVDDGSQDRRHVEDMRRWSREEPRIVVTEREANGGIAAASNEALVNASGDFCVFSTRTTLAPDALLWIAQRIARAPAGADGVWRRGLHRRVGPAHASDAQARLGSGMATQHQLRAAPRGRADGVPAPDRWPAAGTRRRAGLGSLAADREEAPIDAIEHVPQILYHWRVHAGSTAAGINEKSGIVAAQKRALADTLARRKQDATLELTPGGWRVRYALPSPAPLASLVIATRDHPRLLAMCVKGLRERTDYANWQAVVVDNGTVDAEAVALLRELARDLASR
jgi:hypothetical protein